MSTTRLIFRLVRPSITPSMPLSTTVRRLSSPGNAKEHETVPEHRKIQMDKPLNPHLSNTNSTIANGLPTVGASHAPPDLLSSVDLDFAPKDSISENIDQMTGSAQKRAGDQSSGLELGIGEMEGGNFKVEPLRRTGEDVKTMQARLVYQSRKRGTLESDLLMSTFADAHLQDMTMEQMIQYDLFLDENDWDIYYWATQEPSSASHKTAKGAIPNAQSQIIGSPVARGTDSGEQAGLELETDEWRQGKPRSGEWAQTVGTFKPAYRPVPARWKNSEILAKLRRHVLERSAGGIRQGKVEIGGEALGQGVRGTGGGGMAFMPPVRDMGT